MGEIVMEVLFDGYQVSDLPKAFVADTLDQEYVFDLSKGAVTSPMFDDLFGKHRADIRKALQSAGIVAIYIDEVCVAGIADHRFISDYFS